MKQRSEYGIHLASVGADPGPVDGRLLLGGLPAFGAEGAVVRRDVVWPAVVLQHGRVPRLTKEAEQRLHGRFGVVHQLFVVVQG